MSLRIKVISCTIIASLLATQMSYAADQSLKFSDIKNHWAESSIRSLIEKNIVSGYPNGQFKPNELISRGAFVKMLVSVMGYELKADSTFEDTAKNWADPYVDTAVVNGIIPIEKYGKAFSPDAPMPRFEFAEIICRALKLEPSTTTTAFQDTKDAFANRLYDEYLIRGNYEKGKTYFKPNSFMTRAEATVIINNIMDYQTNADAFKLQKQAEDKINKQVQAGYIAKPDYNFENFINSESASNVISQESVKAKDGILMFYSNNGRYGDYKDGYIVSNAKVKNINIYTYNLVKEMTDFAQKNNLYVKVVYNHSFPCVNIGLYESKFYADAPLGQSLIHISIADNPVMGKDYQFKSKYVHPIVWETCILYPHIATYYQNGGTLANMQKINFRTPEMTSLLNRLFNVVYGTTEGNKLFAFHLKQYDRDSAKPDADYREQVYIGSYELFSYSYNGIALSTNLK